MRYNPPRGFVALISVLMISGIMLLLSLEGGTAAYIAHQAAADERSYREAQQAALSCARFAVSRLYADPLRFSDIGTTTIQLSEVSTCEIAIASSTAYSAGTLTQGESGESSVRIFVTSGRTSTQSPFHILTWTEY